MYTNTGTKLMTDVMNVFTERDNWEKFWWRMYLFGEGLKNLDVTGLGNDLGTDFLFTKI